MATLADELLNDFEDSGSEDEGNKESGFFLQKEDGESTDQANGGMELDGDEEEVKDENEGMDLLGAPKDEPTGDRTEEEEAKDKIEKMELGGVSDVRSVARLMKTLQPILNVSYTISFVLFSTI
jgi:U4/U6 small nuclear ribonucleoprotein PRP31